MTESDTGSARRVRSATVPTTVQRKTSGSREESRDRTSSRSSSSGSSSSGSSGSSSNGSATSRRSSGSADRDTSRSSSSKKAPARKPRRARLRLTQVDAWSVMKTAFLLSIAMGIVTVVAVAIVWSVLGAAGVFDSINNTVQTVLGNDFQVQDYAGTGRVVGFTMLVAVVDVVLLTAIATLGAFLYNLSATLLGGVELTLTEDG